MKGNATVTAGPKRGIKLTKRQVYKFLLNCIIIVVGNAITAAASAFFIVPNGFVMGGTTGVGIFMRNLLGNMGVTGVIVDWSVEITVYVLNIALFLLGAFLLGKKFAVSTGAGTFLYPTFLTLFQFANDAYYNANGHYIGMSEELGSPFFAMLCGGLLFGLGIGMVVRVGASTGGTDIPPLIFKKYFNAPISVSIWVLDFAIVALNFIALPSLDAILYGVFITLVSSIVVDKVSPIGMKRTEVTIISDKYEEIREMILTKVSRGVTVLYGQTGYLRKDCHVILTVVSSRQLVRLKAELDRIDPKAFITFSTISEVQGRGFRTEGVDFLLPQDEEDRRLHPEDVPKGVALPPEERLSIKSKK